MGCFNKFALFVTNFIVFGVGVAVVTLSSIVISKDSTYKVLLGDGVFSLPIIVLIVGLIILLIGFLGCCGAMKESECMLYLYAGIVIVLLLAEIVMGIMVLVYSNRDDIFTDEMDKIFRKYGGDDHALNKAIDEAQHELKCCGVHNYTDWENYPYGMAHNNSLADGCCKGSLYAEGCGQGILVSPGFPNNTYTEGCFYAIKNDIKDAAIGLGVACLILAVVQCFSISCACQIAKHH